VLIALVWWLRFKWQERLFGIAGLLMIVFLVAAIARPRLVYFYSSGGIEDGWTRSDVR
jgi:hypothetical protein